MLFRADEKAAVLARLTALEPTIKHICAVAGTPGISIGVSFKGEAIYRASYGVKDVEASLPTDSDTVFPIGTLAKTFTASAIGMLVHEGLLKWDTPIRDILPNFKSKNSTVEENLTIVDLLSHRSGLARSNYWWQGAERALLLEKQELLPFYSKLEKTGSFRGDWAYSNWGYAVAGEVIERLSGMSFGAYVSKNVLEPLQLKNTTMQAVNANSNWAKPYAALDDASPFLLPRYSFSDENIMNPAMGGASSANDLLKYSMALLESHRFESGKCSAVAALKNGLMHLSGHIFTAKATLEKSYAFGFYRSQLPSNVLGMGWNSIYVKSMPKLVPRGHCGPVIAHGGSLPGYHSSIAILPEIDASVIVCTNSIALGDTSGWTSLALIEALIDTPTPSDFRSLASEAAENNVRNVSKLLKSLEEAKKPGTTHKPLDEYVGRYTDSLHDWIIDVHKKENNGLEVAFQGLESQTWALSHYECDTFLWLASREEQAKRCRMTTYPLIGNHFKIIFQQNAAGAIDRLCWPHEAAVPVNEQYFTKL
ncbi:MAG: hypothetical protein Q9191_000169 [Dirinaria sp. TL-2023a]